MDSPLSEETPSASPIAEPTSGEVRPREEIVRLGAGAPPWLWIWAVLQLINIFSSWQGFDHYLHLYFLDLWNAPFVVRVLYGLSAGVDWLVPFCLFGGVIVALFPGIRSAYIERTSGLNDLPEDAQWAREVRIFVATHAPRLEIKANLLRASQIGFVYPSRLGGDRLALFGGFVRLWRSNRQSAESILLHEIEHYRRGDNLILGAGSLFEGGIRASLILLAGVVLLLVALIHSATGVIPAHTGSFVVAMVIQILQPFLIPVLCIWFSEFNADRFAVDSAGSAEGIRRSLDLLRGGQRFVRAVLMRLTHPPVWLRRAMLGIPDSRWVGAIFAMLFAGLLASDIFFWMGKSLLGNHALGAKAIVAGAFWDALLVANTKWFATMGLLAIFWPRIARAWDSFFTRSSLSAYRWPVSTGRAWCFFLLALFAFSLFVKNVGASMSSQEAANNPQEILGVWQLRTNQNTYLQFLNDGTFVLLTKIGDEFAGGVGTYRFADNIHVEMKSSVVLNGAGVLAASPNSDQTAEVEFFNDQLRLSYDPDTQPQDWSRATDGTDPNNLVHSQGAQAYQPGDQNQLAPDTTQPTAGADQTIQSRDLYRYSGQ